MHLNHHVCVRLVSVFVKDGPKELDCGTVDVGDDDMYSVYHIPITVHLRHPRSLFLQLS